MIYIHFILLSGKYEPVGALASSEIVSATETKEVAPVKNIFSDLFESNQTLNQSVIPGPKSSAKSATDGHRVGNLYSDLLSSNIDFVPSAPSIHLGRGKPTSIKSVIHRDIFLGGAVEENGSGTTNKKVRVAQGDLALAKRGDYQFEHDDDDGDGAFGSDQDNTDEGEKGKKTKKKKDTSRSDGIAGPNRAARRALANGNGSL